MHPPILTSLLCEFCRVCFTTPTLLGKTERKWGFSDIPKDTEAFAYLVLFLILSPLLHLLLPPPLPPRLCACFLFPPFHIRMFQTCLRIYHGAFLSWFEKLFHPGSFFNHNRSISLKLDLSSVCDFFFFKSVVSYCLVSFILILMEVDTPGE